MMAVKEKIGTCESLGRIDANRSRSVQISGGPQNKSGTDKVINKILQQFVP